MKRRQTGCIGGFLQYQVWISKVFGYDVIHNATRSGALSLPIQEHPHSFEVKAVKGSLTSYVLGGLVGLVLACLIGYSIWLVRKNPKRIKKLMAHLVKDEGRLAFQALFELWGAHACLLATSAQHSPDSTVRNSAYSCVAQTCSLTILCVMQISLLTFSCCSEK